MGICEKAYTIKNHRTNLCDGFFIATLRILGLCRENGAGWHFLLLGLPQKCNFCGKRRNNGMDGIFAA